MSRLQISVISALAAGAISALVLRPAADVAARSEPRSSAPEADLPSGPGLDREPLAFIPNRGQWDSPALFVASLGAMTVFLEERGWTLTLEEWADAPDRATREIEARETRGVAIRLRFTGCETSPGVGATGRLPGHHNYFIGDPSRWRTEIPRYGSVRYSTMYTGVDVTVRQQGERFEYDLLLEPGADLGQVEVQVEGAEALHLDEDGGLVIETELGELRQPRPVTWEVTAAGEKRPVDCHFVLVGPARFGFAVPLRQGDLALVVDPKLDYSTLLGGVGDDKAYAMAKNASVGPVVVGSTTSGDFPTTLGAWSRKRKGTGDAFVTRLNYDLGSLKYSTFLGGQGFDAATGVALDGSGAAVVVGYTKSKDFPTTFGAYQTTFGGGSDDCFVTKLDPSGGVLAYSTFLGGSHDEGATAVAVSSNGVATVTGGTHSFNFPTTSGAFQKYLGGPSYDAFVTRLTASGTKLVYSTFLGGTVFDSARALALAFGGTTIVTGYTESTNFPTTKGAYDTTYGGGGDVFVTRVDAVGGSLVYSTYLGSATWEDAYGVALDAQGRATVAGRTNGQSFPTTPMAWDRTFNGSTDVFVTRLGPQGKQLTYSTFLGGWSHEGCYGLSLLPNGEAVVAGGTVSNDFPTTTGAWDRKLDGLYDAFTTRLSANGTRLLYSTLLGGTGDEQAEAVIAIKRPMDTLALVAGRTMSSDFPTTALAWQDKHKGGFDAFVTQIPLAVAGIRYYGESTPACKGPQRIYAMLLPEAGKPFVYGCDAAPPEALGLLLLGLKGLDPGLPVLGIKLAVDITPGTVLPLWVRADKNGFNFTLTPIPPGIQGLRVYGQYIWLNTSACGGIGTLSCSDALEVTVQ